jgi:hypothetical protein
MAILMASAFSLGLPPVLPLARSASRPALVRSEIRLCSNSAYIAMSWKNSMPVGVLVLTSSVSDTTWMFRFSAVRAFRLTAAMTVQVGQVSAQPGYLLR